MIEDKIIALTGQLYPRGRAFKMPKGGTLEKLHRALSVVEAKAYSDSLSVLDSILPDNDNFTAEDATAWERRLGMISNEEVDLEDRKLAIRRKLAFPGTVKPRQSASWLQKQLQDAGFNVYVFENFNGDAPEDVAVGDFIDDNNHGEFNHGEFNHGGSYNNLIANHIDEEKDFGFDPGTSLKSTFFIGGTPLGTFANVPAERKDEFRQLILRVKPVQAIGFLFINYV